MITHVVKDKFISQFQNLIKFSYAGKLKSYKSIRGWIEMDHYTATLKKNRKKGTFTYMVGKSFLFYDCCFIGEHLCFKNTGNWNTTVTAHTQWRWFKYYIYVNIFYKRGRDTVMWYSAFSHQSNPQLYAMLTPVRKLDPRISHCLIRSKRSADP